MEDMAAKIQEVLSDKESMKQLQELAQMFSSSEDNKNDENSENTAESDNIFPDFDISMLLKLQSIMGQTQNDDTAGLLIALKPLLKEERRHKVDKALKVLRLLAVWDILKDSGLMNDFFG